MKKPEDVTSISEIELVPLRLKNGLTFFADCVLDGKYFLGGVAVFTRRDGSGFRCVYPTKKLINGKQIPLFYPIARDVGQEIEKAISLKATQLLTSDNFHFSVRKEHE